MSQSLLAFEQCIGYSFVSSKLLKVALTHRSACKEHNERLEFLGDSILNMLIAEYLFSRFKKANEGDLSRMRATLVCEKTLAQIARTLGLGDVLKLGPGEEKDGGRQRDSILSDALEAVVGAIYLDANNFDIIRKILLGWYQSLLSEIHLNTDQKDPKTRLQEWLQGRGSALPVYTVAQVCGKSHQQSFTVHCAVEGIPSLIVSVGTSRRRAEQAAAAKALQYLEQQS